MMHVLAGVVPLSGCGSCVGSNSTHAHTTLATHAHIHTHTHTCRCCAPQQIWQLSGQHQHVLWTCLLWSCMRANRLSTGQCVHQMLKVVLNTWSGPACLPVRSARARIG